MKVVFSLDFELGWGVIDSNRWKHNEAIGVYRRLREIFPPLLKMMEDLNFPCTWAVVSSMLCENKDDVQLDHLKPGYRQAARGFLDLAEYQTWNGRDLCDQLFAKAIHEIATHTATHLYASHPSADVESFVTDVGLSLEQLRNYKGIDCSSIIFPRDQADYKKAVAERFGLCARMNPAYGKSMRPLARAGRALRNIGGGYPSSMILVGEHNELYHVASINFNWYGGRYAAAKKHILTRQVKSLLTDIEQGNRRGEMCHFWLHPFNLAENEELYALFIETIQRLARLRDRGFLKILTIAQANSEIPHFGVAST